MVKDRDVVCSFCDKGVSEVEVMITGNGEAGICAACIDAAVKIVDARRGGQRMEISTPNNRRRRARARQSRKPTEHQVAVLEELLHGGYIGEGTPTGDPRGWHLVDRDGGKRRDAIRSTTIARLVDERWIERPDRPAAGEQRWSVSAAGRLVLARHRKGDFGLVVLRGGIA